MTLKEQSISRETANIKKICVLGLGYIGLPTACLFATNGYQVVGVDKDEAKANAIQQWIPPWKMLKE